MSQKKFNKHADDDKWDAYMPNRSWLQDNFDASRWIGSFHSQIAYAYFLGSRKGFTLGTQKKIVKASGYGINTDASAGYIGKSDL